MILDEPDKGINRTWTEISIDWLFYLVGVSIMAISLVKILVTPQDSLDLPIYDSFVVIAGSPTLLLIGLFWVILGLIYSYVNRKQGRSTNRNWGLFHFLLTLFGSILVSSPYYLYYGFSAPDPGNNVLFEHYYISRDIYLTGVAIFALGQLLLLHLVKKN